MTLGEKLRSLRAKTKRTLEEQSRLLKVPENVLYRWEYDLEIPKRSVLKEIANYYGVPLNWLRTDAKPVDTGTTLYEDSILGMFKNLPGESRYKLLKHMALICVRDQSYEYKRKKSR